VTSTTQPDPRPPPRRSVVSRRALAVGVGLVLVAAAVVAARAGLWDQGG
jgi:hypothetical protein